MRSRSLGARSCCKNRYLVTLTFAPLERNRGSRAQIHKNSMLFDNFLVHGSLQQPGAAGGTVETGQMSSVETRQMSQQQSSVLSQQQTSVLSQQKTSILSQQQILCVSETCSGPDTSKSPYLDNRKVTFQTDGTPKSRIAVRFQWAWSRGELLKN